jgi:hypothetical protein
MTLRCPFSMNGRSERARTAGPATFEVTLRMMPANVLLKALSSPSVYVKTQYEGRRSLSAINTPRQHC